MKGYLNENKNSPFPFSPSFQFS